MSPSPAGVVGTIVILAVLSTLAVALRVYVRRIRKLGLKADDWTILAGLVLTWIYAIIMLAGVGVGSFGGHTAIDPITGIEIVTSKEHVAVELETILYIMMTIIFGTIKLSVLLLYQRLFIGWFFQRYLTAICSLIICWTLSFMFAFAFMCGPDLSNAWISLATYEEHCDNTSALSLAFVASDVGTDLLALAIPIPIVWKLQKTALQRLAICGIFLLGLLSTAAAIARLGIEAELDYGTTSGRRDVIGDVTDLSIWGLVEAALAIIAACLPTLRPLFYNRHLLAKSSSSRPQYTKSSSLPDSLMMRSPGSGSGSGNGNGKTLNYNVKSWSVGRTEHSPNFDSSMNNVESTVEVESDGPMPNCTGQWTLSDGEYPPPPHTRICVRNEIVLLEEEARTATLGKRF